MSPLAWLLQENPAHRPQSWEQVLQHPAFASVAGPATHKRVVMSCPEMGTLDEDGGVARMEAGADAKAVYNHAKKCFFFHRRRIVISADHLDRFAQQLAR